jgi:uncharacterized protein (TIGR02145 family)
LEYKSTQFCAHNSVVLEKCGGNIYDSESYFCQGSQLHSCGGQPHNPATHSCHEGQLYSCGNQPYAPATQFCYNSSKVGNFCGTRTETFDPDIYECKPSINANGIYLKTPVSYQGKSYEAVLIGEQVWFAENLNYEAEGSKCYAEGVANVSADSIAKNCDAYGRLYDWATANAVCPAGWHLPSNAEWDALFRFADGTNGTSSPYNSPTAGRYLKATSGWNSGGNGEDTYGFAALPGGSGYSGGSFYDVGNYGDWWSASEYYSDYAYYRYMGYGYEYASWNYDDKGYLFSVRCAQD